MEKEKMILSSLWFGSSKPSMGTFLKPFQKTLIELYTGIQCESQKEGIFKCLREVFCAIIFSKMGRMHAESVNKKEKRKQAAKDRPGYFLL